MPKATTTKTKAKPVTATKMVKDAVSNLLSPIKSAPSKKSSNSNSAAAASDSLLYAFFIDELKDIYWAEKLLTKTLPKMAKAATSTKLRTAFQDHLKVTETHVSRLEKVFALLGQTPRAKKCEAMDGIVNEGKTIIEDTDAGTATRDVGLILAAQKVEHYEISTYGGLAQLARTLGQDKAASLLEQTLGEEKDADQSLTGLAEGGINDEACQEAA